MGIPPHTGCAGVLSSKAFYQHACVYAYVFNEGPLPFGLSPEGEILSEFAVTREKPSGQLSSGVMLVFVSLLASFPMLSTDLYLPAVPLIRMQLNTTVELVNSTLVVFFIFISISTLICGPLSDRFGRKPVLLSGVGLYFIASVACFLSSNIYILILSRVFQAVGAGAGMALASAIVKDFFPPNKMEKAFALIGALVGIVPIVAPVIGAQLLKWMSWRGAFAALALIGLISFIFVLFFKETNFDRSTGGISASIVRLFIVLKNPSFSRLAVLFSLSSLPLLAFIGVSAILYVQGFGLTEQQFSLYFAANAIVSIAGSFFYIYLARFIRPMRIITSSFILSLTSAGMILWIGGRRPIFLLLSVAVGMFGASLQRPPSMNLMLAQQERDTGSASSLISSLKAFLGSVGLYLISLEWENRVLVLGMMFAVVSVCGFPFWLYAKQRCRIPRNLLNS